MREHSSPGLRGVPIAVWRSLPEEILAQVAELLNLIEKEQCWPVEFIQAFVTMIPKASGGSRPQDQRPITVLDVLYRLWGKGIVMEWTPQLQSSYLGSAAMGFRAQSSTLHLAQLLSDLMVHQSRRRAPLWLASLDIEKCFPSLPWWAVFGVLSYIGVNSHVVSCFRSFYTQLRQHFRYGAVDGSEWHVANGLAQGCPASPDLLNILFEPFHRWAAAQYKGVLVGDTFIASASFADDVALVATSWEELEFLLQGYLRWCRLLGLKINLTKTQLWSSGGAGRLMRFCDGDAVVELISRSTFRIVGIELGSSDKTTTSIHATPRMEKAMLSGKRLASLPVPTAVAAQIWRSLVLPQALYGCELRRYPLSQLTPLLRQGRQVVAHKAPLSLSVFGAIEVITGLPLGACAVRDPRLEALSRQLKWVVTLANLPGLIGTLHRELALDNASSTWMDPTPALAAALAQVGWQLVRNSSCLRAPQWPVLEAEPAYGGRVVMTPQSGLPPAADAVWTDGSVGGSGGGAAVLQPSTGRNFSCHVPSPSSSTQCELVALSLVGQFAPPPSMVLTDSLVSLQLLHSWGRRSLRAILACPERAEVRRFLHHWQGSPAPPVLVKVKAHDTLAIQIGDPRACGNDLVDGLAKQAASVSGAAVGCADDMRFADAVLLQDSNGGVITDLDAAITAFWWSARRSDGAARRPSWC